MNFIEMMREILNSDKWTSGLHGERQNAMLSSDASPAAEAVPPPELLPGMRIEWKSPLFGTLTGEVLDADEAYILVWHPKAEDLRNIPVKWVTRTLTGPEGITSVHQPEAPQ